MNKSKKKIKKHSTTMTKEFFQKWLLDRDFRGKDNFFEKHTGGGRHEYRIKIKENNTFEFWDIEHPLREGWTMNAYPMTIESLDNIHISYG